MLKDREILPPLWIAYPMIPSGSLGWRMGWGETYAYKFADWFADLSDDEKQEYIKLFPEPQRWNLYWEFKQSDEETIEEILERSYERIYFTKTIYSS